VRSSWWMVVLSLAVGWWSVVLSHTVVPREQATVAITNRDRALGTALQAIQDTIRSIRQRGGDGLLMPDGTSSPARLTARRELATVTSRPPPLPRCFRPGPCSVAYGGQGSCPGQDLCPRRQREASPTVSEQQRDLSDHARPLEPSSAKLSDRRWRPGRDTQGRRLRRPERNSRKRPWTPWRGESAAERKFMLRAQGWGFPCFQSNAITSRTRWLHEVAAAPKARK